MDQATLVREQVDGGSKLLARLTAAGVSLTGACWAKTADDGLWYLYLVSPEVDGADPRPVYRQIRNILQQMHGEWGHPFERIDPFVVKLAGPSDPVGRAVLDWYSRFPGLGPTWSSAGPFGSVYVDGAYVYPPTVVQPHPAAQPA